MSNAALNAVFDHSKTRPAARLVMLALADRADDHGKAWPSIADIMRRTALSRSATHSAINEARKLGELEVALCAGPMLCNIYAITLSTRSDSGPRPDSGPVQILNAPVQILDKTRSESGPKPSVTQKNPHSLERAKRKKGPEASNDPDFAEFWSAYPRKVAKPDALRAWKSTAADRPPLPELLAAIEKHKASRQWQDPEKIAYPATWLNKHRWADELTAAATATTPRPVALRL